MKKGLLILFILSSFNSKGTIHQIQVWSGYMQFLPSNNIIVQLGDTIQWTPLDPPTMSHTITSNNIPAGAVPFDQIWQMPADTFFQYIPQVAGLYQYVCTPHIPNGMIGEFTVINGAVSQKTYVPDDTFEQCLIELGIDNFLDDSVLTSSIDTVTTLPLYPLSILWPDTIFDLTGVEGFVNLRLLNISYVHQLRRIDLSQNIQLEYLYLPGEYDYDSLGNSIAFDTLGIDTLDLSNNINLIKLDAENNNIKYLDLRNGNNYYISKINIETNFNLTCINVDDSVYSTNNWNGNGTNLNGESISCEFDPQQYYSNDCSFSTSISENQNSNKSLLKITDVLGRETQQKKNTPLFYIFDDGTVEKKIIIE